MIKTKTFVAILFLEIEPNITKTIYSDFDFRISSNIQLVKNILNTGDIRNIIGYNEAQALEFSNCFYYSESDFDVSIENFNDRNCLIGKLLLIELFSHALWLVKDNSIHCELAHLYFSTNKGYTIHSNFWNTSYTNALGVVENMSFSNDELDQAIKLFPIVIATNYIKKPLENSAIKVTSNTTRLSRAFYFIQSARNSTDIGTKISLYCSVLESIFSVSTSELKHRLSETVAFFLEDNYDDRKIVYKALQNAYDIRSSVVHGDGIQSKFLKNDSALLLKSTRETDEIIRRCIRKIISTNELYELFTEKNRDEIAEYLQNLIFKK
jgi:hypothetical protein